MSCTNKKLNIPPGSPSSPLIDNSCKYKSNSIISYSVTVSPILMNNCMPCHSSPTSFAMDDYASVKATAQSGQLMTVVTNTIPLTVTMPPPPQRHLDSCEIKALNLWISQGCLNN